MSRVVLLTARDPLAAGDAASPVTTAAELAGDGHEVVLVLLEDAVGLARPDHRFADRVGAAADAGVRVLVEEEALHRRAIGSVGAGLKTTALGEIVDLLFDWSDRRAWL